MRHVIAEARVEAHLVFTVEHLRGSIRRIGLVLVDERRDLVDRLAVGIQRRARQRHEVRVATRHIQRIIRLQRHVDRAEPALADEIEAVVEELAEDRHPAVEWRRQTRVRRDVRDEQRRL